ncbi:unnamed protein product, partial [Prorocentrum cordatum]
MLASSGLPTPSELQPRFGSSGAEGLVRKQFQEFETWRSQQGGSSSSPPTGSEEVDQAKQMEASNLSALEGYCEAVVIWFEGSGWSGDIETYLNVWSDPIFEHSGASGGRWSLLSSRGEEVKLKGLAVQEWRQFRQSDEADWRVLNRPNLPGILGKKEPTRVLRTRPEQVLSSRMARRWKAQEGAFSAPKAESRRCVHGFADPGTEHPVTYSPSESMMLFDGRDLVQSVVDCKNAFSQSLKLRWSGGPMCVAPCEGLTVIHVPEGCLIELRVAVCGLDDAPWEWRVAITSYLRVLIEVGDLWLGAAPTRAEWLADSMKAGFPCGTWRGNGAEFAWRRVRRERSRIRVYHEKYILEGTHPIILEKCRRSERRGSLGRSEFEQPRSGIYRINWAARETRLEVKVSGAGSILASRLQQAVVGDIVIFNWAVQMLRNTASQYLTMLRRDLSRVVSLTLSNTAGIGADSPI